jgi:hypothetical protein
MALKWINLSPNHSIQTLNDYWTSPNILKYLYNSIANALASFNAKIKALEFNSETSEMELFVLGQQIFMPHFKFPFSTYSIIYLFVPNIKRKT